MNIDFYGKNMALTPAIKAYIQKKIGSLEKFTQKIVETRVEVGSDVHHRRGMVFRCEVHMTLPHGVIYASETAEDLYASVDLVKEEAERQLLKLKEKRQSKRRKIARSRRANKGAE